MTATRITLSRRTLKATAAEQAEHHELAGRRREHAVAGRGPVDPPHEDGDGEGVGVLGQQLVGVDQQRRRRGQHGHHGQGEQAPDPPAYDAVDHHQPSAEAGHLDELQAVVVETPEVDERRQQQRPAPRVGVRAEAAARVDHREAVVGDDLADVALEDAAGLAQVEREVVALGCGRCDGGRSPTRPRWRRRRRGRCRWPRAAGPTAPTSTTGERSSGRLGAIVAAGFTELRPRPWIAARRSATFSALNMVRCQARESRASCSQASSSWAMAAYVARTWRTPSCSLPEMSSGQRAGERQQLVVGDDVVDEPEAQRLLGVEEVAGEAHLPSPAHADGLRQEHGQAPPGHARRRGRGCRRTWPARRRRGSRS